MHMNCTYMVYIFIFKYVSCFPLKYRVNQSCSVSILWDFFLNILCFHVANLYCQTHIINEVGGKRRGTTLQGRRNERDGISNHRRSIVFSTVLFGCRSKETSKLRVIALCEGNPPVTERFPSQKASNADFFQFDDVIMNTCFNYFDWQAGIMVIQ